MASSLGNTLAPKLLLLLIVVSSGCNALKSRYAMSDPVYAKKYADGAERFDFIGKLKQAIDARHVKGLGGWYASGGALYRPKLDNTMGGADVGFEYYDQSWLSQRIGLASYFSEEDGYLGLETSVRVQLPTRITPFAGVGTILGLSRTVTDDPDGIDNDDDTLVDEEGELASSIDHILGAVYPEVGLHTWLNGNWRVSAFGRYMITTMGRDHDDWLIGGQLTFFPRRPDF
jgi:hypothetical protein